MDRKINFEIIRLLFQPYVFFYKDIYILIKNNISRIDHVLKSNTFAVRFS